jgi:hypothetical protein
MAEGLGLQSYIHTLRAPAETWAWCIMDGILALLEVSVVIAESGSADNSRLEF